MPRLFMLLAVLLALAVSQLEAAQADDTPRDLAALAITIRPDGDDVPRQVSAGRYLVTVENRLREGTAISFVLPPGNHTLAEAHAALSDPGAAADWLYGARFIGGPHAGAGERGQAIIDLTPGEWLIWSGEQTSDRPWSLTVTESGVDGEMPAEPEADVSLDVREYAFWGLDAGVPSGPQLWRITNSGEQPHLMDLLRAPGPITFAQIMTLLALPDGAAPPSGIPAANEFEQVAGLGTISPGETSWVVFPDLAPGTYVALCFVPDREFDGPHAAMGMVQVFTVAAPTSPAV